MSLLKSNDDHVFVKCDAPDCQETIDLDGDPGWDYWGSRVDLNLDWCPKHNSEAD